MSQLAALERQLSAYGESDVWAAEVEMCRGIAQALDDEDSDANLWREYRQALKALREVLKSHDSGPAEDLDSEFDALGRTDIRDTADS